jgi:hypothetical protein
MAHKKNGDRRNLLGKQQSTSGEQHCQQVATGFVTKHRKSWMASML